MSNESGDALVNIPTNRIQMSLHLTTYYGFNTKTIKTNCLWPKFFKEFTYMHGLRLTIK